MNCLVVLLADYVIDADADMLRLERRGEEMRGEGGGGDDGERREGMRGRGRRGGRG